jgi:hypothetical protein
VAAVLLGFAATPLAMQTAETKPQPATAESGFDQPARETRRQLHEVLQQYPPSLRQILRLDPSLMTRKDYLTHYPVLEGFLARHPEISHNSDFYMGPSGFGEPGFEAVRRDKVYVDAVGEILAMVGGFGALFLLIALTASGVKMLVEHRRWLRISALQAEAHSKLLDRLTSNEDLLSYLQSPAGRQFLEAAPAVVPRRLHPINAPINRILWSVQVGVVLILVGVGMLSTRSLVNEVIGQVLSTLGVLTFFLGAGFVLSGLVAYFMSKMFGLFDPPAVRSDA